MGGVTLAWAAATDVGRRRSVNEDAVLAEPPVFLVADGMGGHQAGDVASALVVDRFEHFANGAPAAMGDVAEAIRSVNSAIREQGRAAVAQNGMGTTAVGLLVVDNGERTSLLLFNIGDSRAYRMVDGSLEQLSVDHSYVQELVAAGRISPGAAREHPDRNVVTRALGVADSVQADYWLRVPAPGERYLLCSDGLTSEVDDTQVAEVLGAASSADDAAQQLIDRALEAGGRDNITVLVVDVVDVDASDGHTGDTAPRPVVAKGADASEPADAEAHGEAAANGRTTNGGPSVEAGPELLDVPSVMRRAEPDGAPPTAGGALIEGVPPLLAADAVAGDGDEAPSEEPEDG